MLRRIIDSRGITTAIVDLRLQRALTEFRRRFGNADPEWLAAAARLPHNAEILAHFGLVERPEDVLDIIERDFEPLPCDRHRTIFDVRQLELKL
jgi:hypothetical protein